MYNAQIYTDWANHYLEKVDSKCFITDLQSDISTGVVLSDLVFAVGKFILMNIHTIINYPSHITTTVC